MSTQTFARTLPLVLTAFAVSAGLLGCHRVYYNQIVGTAVQTGFVDPHARTITLQLEDWETNEPLPDVRVWIDSDETWFEGVTNAEGYVTLPLHPLLFINNPRLRHDTDRRVRLSFRGTMSLTLGEHTPPRYVSPDGLARVSNDAAELFVASDQREAARAVFRRLGEHHDAVAETLGLRPVPWSVILITGDPDHKGGYTTATLDNGRTPWIYTWAEIDSGRFDNVNPHEWAESTIGHALSLHDADPHGRNRVFIDGLAELAAFRLTGETREGDLLALDELAGEAAIDLPARFRSITDRGSLSVEKIRDLLNERGFAPGYPLALAFWLELTNDGRNADLPQRFCAALLDQPNRDFDACIALLERLSGRAGLADRLQHFPVAEARERLASHLPDADDDAP